MEAGGLQTVLTDAFWGALVRGTRAILSAFDGRHLTCSIVNTVKQHRPPARNRAESYGISPEASSLNNTILHHYFDSNCHQHTIANRRQVRGKEGASGSAVLRRRMLR